MRVIAIVAILNQTVSPAAFVVSHQKDTTKPAKSTYTPMWLHNNILTLIIQSETEIMSVLRI